MEDVNKCSFSITIFLKHLLINMRNDFMKSLLMNTKRVQAKNNT